MRESLKDLAYNLYDQRLASALTNSPKPAHVGVILDGNRRWAADQGSSTAHGHRAGGAKITEFLGWCEEVDVQVVTLWLLSTDNLNRPEAELAPLLTIIEETVTDLASTNKWRINHVGARNLLPEHTAAVIQAAQDATTENSGLLVNVAVAYGGRQEVVDAVRSLLVQESEAGHSIQEIAKELSAEDIAAHLYTKGQPDPDLVIRTSGEQRLSGFLLWQSAHSEFYFCEAYWPSFRKVDFLRALRAYGQRHRRFGV